MQSKRFQLCRESIRSKRNFFTGKKAIEKLCCTRDDWNNIYGSIYVKINTLEQMQIFLSGKNDIPENKPAVCIYNVTQQIFHAGSFV